ncbi:hypothetical protein [Leptospira adleri]|uniref:Uncharacterized protein n=1 Tax=Leptospira adleri TaxID=2023186 RepID=A0A2M9YLP3_9LEPT|nr:hypothetical protein [Leptospira adleri]PJZ52350.1 hypothetical protein CH380_15740 [Leptospira adleri]PJZ63557.1 hypothetical protein CH376_02760 [Leptospira adleri]
MIVRILSILIFLTVVNCASWERLVSSQRWEWIGSSHYKPTQIFVIDPKKDSEIEADEGTKIQFPSGSLVDADGNPISTSLRIEVSEYYKSEDILLSGLTTASLGRPIQTKGMIFLNAFAESGIKAQANPKNPPKVSFAGNVEPGFQIFYGSKTKEGTVDWSTEVARTTNVSKADLELTQPSPTKSQTASQPSRRLEMRIAEDAGSEERPGIAKSNYFPILSLGWINCDRFLYMGARLVSLSIEADYPSWEEETTYQLIIPSIRSVMPAYKDASNRIVFPNLPPGEKTIVYALKRSGVTRWRIWTKEVIVGKEEKLVPNWELVRPKELLKRIQSLNF